MRAIVLILICAFSLGSEVYAQQQQGSLVFFSDDGDRFYVILNGELQNSTPQTNVKINFLNATNYKLKVIFENVAFKEIAMDIGVFPNIETTYIIERYAPYFEQLANDIRNETQADNANETPTNSAIGQWDLASSEPSRRELILHSHSLNLYSSININQAIGQPLRVPNNPSIKRPNYNDAVITLDVNTSVPVVPNPNHVQPMQLNVVQQPNVHNNQLLISCAPMSNFDFLQAIQSIESKSFADSRLNVAKQISSSNCLSAEQVKQIMLLFSFEDDKLAFAKFAYNNCSDRNNYFIVNDAFSFESSIDELNRHIGF